MDYLRRRIGVVFTLAFLLMAGGQVLHACVNFDCCQEERGTDDPSTCPDAHDCPIGHCGCHSLSCMNSTMPDSTDVFFGSDISGSFTVRNEACDEGPCREIDHPPQLA